MKTMIYTVHDRVAEESGPLFEAKNNGVARRQFFNLMHQREQELTNVEDYSLLCVGIFDHDTSVITPELVPTEIVRGFSAQALEDSLQETEDE